LSARYFSIRTYGVFEFAANRHPPTWAQFGPGLHGGKVLTLKTHPF